MKKPDIILAYVPHKSKYTLSDKALKVITSNCPQIWEGAFTDWGKVQIAADEGYSIKIN